MKLQETYFHMLMEEFYKSFNLNLEATAAKHAPLNLKLNRQKMLKHLELISRPETINKYYNNFCENMENPGIDPGTSRMQTGRSII